jgi:hypothetical protein
MRSTQFELQLGTSYPDWDISWYSSATSNKLCYDTLLSVLSIKMWMFLAVYQISEDLGVVDKELSKVTLWNPFQQIILIVFIKGFSFFLCTWHSFQVVCVLCISMLFHYYLDPYVKYPCCFLSECQYLPSGSSGVYFNSCATCFGGKSY